MNKDTTLLYFLLFFFITSSFSQTANDAIKPYNEPFRPGINLGYFPGLNNEQLADLAAGNQANGTQGIGAKSIRTGIFNEFVEVWGYDFLKPTYDYFDARGLKENTVIVGFPAPWFRDQTEYCAGKQSTMFANLYDPIFDDGANGTPVNDNNYLALYLYKLVTQYKDHVRFWEIWNEPGSDLPTGFQVGWRQPGFPGNWWENNPDPCDNILHAPIYHYVRTLRVAYEVIKSVDANAYVSVAGFGYPAFLDAVLRNTDNPVDGSPTAEYPLGGGAYFDVFGNHSYPHFDGSTTNFDEGRFERHSDRAADGIVTRRIEFEEVMAKYGYDGITYPFKPSIITEVNVPRKQFGDFIGGLDVQTNFIMKAFIKAKTNKVLALHPFNMIERDEYNSATTEFGVMGMYENFNTFGQQVPTGEAIAYKTTSDLLFNTTYDASQTAAMQLPPGVRGHAFKATNGNYVYTLWAETTVDFSEVANATYSFPASLNVGDLELIRWNYSQNQQSGLASSNNIPLTARPLFMRTPGNIPPPPPPVDNPPPPPVDNPPPPPPVDNPPPPPVDNPPTIGNGIDLSLEMRVDKPNFKIYETLTFSIILRNDGNQTAKDIRVLLKNTKDKLAYAFHAVSDGEFIDWVEDWKIAELAPGGVATLDLGLFTLQDANAQVIFAQIDTASPNDIDSAPNNNAGVVPIEDDEAAITIVPFNNLNGVNAESRAVEFGKSGLHIQQVMPNPAINLVRMRILSKKETEVQITVLNPHGQQLLQLTKSVKEGINYAEIPIASLASGMYFIQLEGNGGRRQPIRFVKQRM